MRHDWLVGATQAQPCLPCQASEGQEPTDDKQKHCEDFPYSPNMAYHKTEAHCGGERATRDPSPCRGRPSFHEHPRQ